MQKRKSNFILFSIGALGYGLLEIMWRGYTHWSMLTAGGICFVFFGSLNEKMKKSGIITKAFIGSAFVTAIEFTFGVIFNIILKKNVWDYSRMPFNIGGQVCATYSFLWMLIGIVAIPFAGKINNRLQLKK